LGEISYKKTKVECEESLNEKNSPFGKIFIKSLYGLPFLYYFLTTDRLNLLL